MNKYTKRIRAEFSKAATLIAVGIGGPCFILAATFAATRPLAFAAYINIL